MKIENFVTYCVFTWRGDIKALCTTYETVSMVDCSNTFNRSMITTTSLQKVLQKHSISCFYCVDSLRHDYDRKHWFKYFFQGLYFTCIFNIILAATQTSDVTTTEGTDYTSIDNMVVNVPANSEIDVDISITAGSMTECSKTFTVTITGSVGITTLVTVTIFDNEQCKSIN